MERTDGSIFIDSWLILTIYIYYYLLIVFYVNYIIIITAFHLFISAYNWFTKEKKVTYNLPTRLLQIIVAY